MNLRQKLIRLAYLQPKLRKDILPLLKKGSDSKVLLVGPSIRVKVNNSFQSILIEELPSKAPFKRKLRAYYMDLGYEANVLHIDLFLYQNLVRVLHKDMTYDAAVQAIKQSWLDAREELLTDLIENPRSRYVELDDRALETIQDKSPRGLGNERTVDYLEVVPVDFKPIVIDKPDFYLKAEWTDFTATVPSQNDYNQADPFYTNISAKSPTGARKLYQILKANSALASKLTMSALEDLLFEHKIPVKHNSSSWH
jgi:hypothetical protein